MRNPYRWLRLKQLDKRLAQWKSAAADAPLPRSGWLKAIRSALGMSTTQLARRLGVDQSRIPRLEAAEVSGAASMSSLRKAADALGCDVVYAIVPRQSLESLVRDRARAIARSEIETVTHSMSLEEQKPEPWVTDAQHDERLASLLNASWRSLWK